MFIMSLVKALHTSDPRSSHACFIDLQCPHLKPTRSIECQTSNEPMVSKKQTNKDRLANGGT